jgi:hypothetical protein
MTTPPRPSAHAARAKPAVSAAAADLPPDRFAVSPGFGPVPAVSVPRSAGRASVLVLGRRAAARAGRLARGWAAGLRQRFQ